MAKKEEFFQVMEYTHVSKKQLELCVVLVLALCRTLMKNGENPIMVQRKREKLLSSLNSLINWISTEKPELNHKSILIKSSDFSPYEDCSPFDEKQKREGSRSLFRRNSVSSRNETKTIIDFPKIISVSKPM